MNRAYGSTMNECWNKFQLYKMNRAYGSTMNECWNKFQLYKMNRAYGSTIFTEPMALSKFRRNAECCSNGIYSVEKENDRKQQHIKTFSG